MLISQYNEIEGKKLQEQELYPGLVEQQKEIEYQLKGLTISKESIQTLYCNHKIGYELYNQKILFYNEVKRKKYEKLLRDEYNDFIKLKKEIAEFEILNGKFDDLKQKEEKFPPYKFAALNLSKYIKYSNPNELSSKVYFLGVISLMDTLFNVDIDNILTELNIDSDIKDALINYEGILGEIYKFAKDIENFNIKAIEEFATKHNMDIESLEKLTFEVIKNANELEKASE